MNYQEMASQVLEKIGGKSNLISGAHCATRLRLVVADEKSIEKDAGRDSTAERDRRWLKADPARARNTATALEPPTDM